MGNAGSLQEHKAGLAKLVSLAPALPTLCSQCQGHCLSFSKLELTSYYSDAWTFLAQPETAWRHLPHPPCPGKYPGGRGWPGLGARESSHPSVCLLSTAGAIHLFSRMGQPDPACHPRPSCPCFPATRPTPPFLTQPPFPHLWEAF